MSGSITGLPNPNNENSSQYQLQMRKSQQIHQVHPLIKVGVVLTFYHPMIRATEFSNWATTDRVWVSGNTSGYKVQASMFSTVV